MKDIAETMGLFATIVFPVFLATPAFVSLTLPVPTLRLLVVVRSFYIVALLSLWAFVIAAVLSLLAEPSFPCVVIATVMTVGALTITWGTYYMSLFLVEVILYRFVMLNREPWLS